MTLLDISLSRFTWAEDVEQRNHQMFFGSHFFVSYLKRISITNGFMILNTVFWATELHSFLSSEDHSLY